jgi:hypothetical protein
MITKMKYNYHMDPRYGGVIWTNHAIQRLRERKITQSDAWYSFQHPDRQLPGKTSGSIRYYKDYGEQRIEVIAKQNEKKEWVILSCWSKILGTGRSIFPKQESVFLTAGKKISRKLWKLIQKRGA